MYYLANKTQHFVENFVIFLCFIFSISNCLSFVHSFWYTMLAIPRVKSFLCFDLKIALLTMQFIGIVISFGSLLECLKLTNSLESIAIMMVFNREYFLTSYVYCIEIQQYVINYYTYTRLLFPFDNSFATALDHGLYLRNNQGKKVNSWNRKNCALKNRALYQCIYRISRNSCYPSWSVEVFSFSL